MIAGKANVSVPLGEGTARVGPGILRALPRAAFGNQLRQGPRPFEPVWQGNLCLSESCRGGYIHLAGWFLEESSRRISSFVDHAYATEPETSLFIVVM